MALSTVKFKWRESYGILENFKAPKGKFYKGEVKPLSHTVQSVGRLTGE